MSKQYLVELKPIDKFFFGGDMTFSIDGDNDEFSSYIVKSNYFPQQTSLLGMMRFLLLSKSAYFENNRIKSGSENEVCELIGEKSFRLNEDENKNYPFGKIYGISRCFILKNGKPLDIAPFIDWSKEAFNIEAKYGDSNFSIPQIKYNHKKGYDKRLCDNTILRDCFQNDLRLGINREVSTGKVENDALYKQISYRFKDSNLAFGFYVTINDDINLLDDKYKGSIVSLGGDNSLFKISIYDEQLSETEQSSKLMVTLLSPSYLLEEDVKLASYAITELVNFNYLQTTVKGTKFYHKTNDNGIRKEKTIQLYDSGSVFYFSSVEAKQQFIQKIQDKNNLQKKNLMTIGYNQFK